MVEPLTTDPLQALTEAFDTGALQAAVQSRDLGEALARAGQAIQEREALLVRLEQMADWVRLLSAQLAPADLGVLTSALDGLRNSLRPFEGQLNSQERLRELAEALKLVDAYARQLEDRLKEVWVNYLKREFSPRARLAEVLQKFPQHVAFALRMRATAKAALGLEQRFPLPEARQTLEKHLRERDTQLQELKRTGAADKSIEFLLRVAEGRATLAYLDPESLKWLADQGALDLFQLTLKASS